MPYSVIIRQAATPIFDVQKVTLEKWYYVLYLSVTSGIVLLPITYTVLIWIVPNLNCFANFPKKTLNSFGTGIARLLANLLSLCTEIRAYLESPSYQ